MVLPALCFGLQQIEGSSTVHTAKVLCEEDAEDGSGAEIKGFAS